MITGKLLITGGAGFLGRGIIRRIQRENWDAEVTVFSRDETKQWDLQHRYPSVRCVLGDVCDEDQLAAVVAGHDIVIHAAAVKYIPEAENNVAVCTAVNVQGSLNVARAAARASVRACVGVSTDKACAPLNTYGATKMLMERIFSEANRWSETRFMTVRYGNVMASTGSVVPVFRQQLRDTGEMRVTDPKMTRFWLSVDDAVDLIDQALTVPSERGAVVIPACAAMGIPQLAQAVWEEYGRAGGPLEAPIKFMGPRPGEKLSEQLYNEAEHTRIYVQDGYFYLSPTTRILSASHRAAGIIRTSYDSAEPSRWLSTEEARKMMRSVETL